MRFWFFAFAWWLAAANVTAELPSWTTLADRARWAANAHNMQSWVLETVPGRTDQRRLVLNPDRLLPQTDPVHRQLTISLGAFLAVLELEAAVRGAAVRWQPLDDQIGVLLTLSEGTTAAAPRETVDGLTAPTVKYRTTVMTLGPDVLKAQETQSHGAVQVRWVTDASEVAEVKNWAQAAFDLEMDLPRTRDESMGVTRYGEDARKTQPWGITLVPNFTREHLFWMETLAALFPQTPEQYARSAKDLLMEALKPVNQILVLTSTGNRVADQIETGRLLQKLWLDVRTRGGELLPLSQGLQEFSEMADFHAEAHRRWAPKGETVQMVLALFRPVPGVFLPSPRIPASGILVP